MTQEQFEILNRLRNLRTSMHLTIKELASLSSVSASEISWIETGRTKPKLATLEKLAKALNTSTKYLIKGE